MRGCGCVAARTTCVGARALEQGLDRPGRHNVARVYCQGEDGGPAKVKSRACVRAYVCVPRACVLEADQAQACRHAVSTCVFSGMNQ